eukprot:2861496-Rhodomonas_salina.3
METNGQSQNGEEESRTATRSAGPLQQANTVTDKYNGKAIQVCPIFTHLRFSLARYLLLSLSHMSGRGANPLGGGGGSGGRASNDRGSGGGGGGGGFGGGGGSGNRNTPPAMGGAGSGPRADRSGGGARSGQGSGQEMGGSFGGGLRPNVLCICFDMLGPDKGKTTSRIRQSSHRDGTDATHWEGGAR